jgi:cellulose synthase/poly-beta-1,6-N-acetylglucosamine synthase-like glycosyltransferase
MRLFEELKQFGFNHRTIQAVDGVNVVPGVFTAFRREVAMELGGFTVGMNGEDGDFTLRNSRMGYRSVMDTNVIVYEDVPPTYTEIREQRVRWSRAVMHNNSRHGPYRAGLATPKVWFSQAHQFFKCMYSPTRLMLPFYLLLVAAFDGSYRTAVVTFLGGWVIFTVSFTALEAVLAFGYRQARHLPWVLLWPFWQECLILFNSEAWLSLPGRPAGLRGSAPAVVAQAVVH